MASRVVGFVVLLAVLGSTVRADTVILLHGLARTSNAMKPLEKALKAEGYAVINETYPSRYHPIEELAPMAIEAALAKIDGAKAEKIHFVTHSLGGILVRFYLEKNTIENLGRVVMLAPPNQGSEVVDTYRNVPGYQAFNGPVSTQLGTDKNSIPAQLGPVAFPLGVIAGNRTFNPILSLSLPNPDDGKVSAASTKVDGMTDFIEMPHTHTFIMRAKPVLAQVKHFLETGQFDHSADE